MGDSLALLKQLFEEHRGTLQGFLRRRSRAQVDVGDLMQEIYLRMLRVKQADLIRNPEGYLFTVAHNLLKERAVRERRFAHSFDVSDPSISHELAVSPALETEVDAAARLRHLKEILAQLSPKCRAAVAMRFREELSYQEIGQRLGISSNMVKKYLTRALAHCRRQMGVVR